MAHREHRLGVSETTLVNRHLKLDSSDLDAVKAAVADIDELYGLDSVSFDEKKLSFTWPMMPHVSASTASKIFSTNMRSKSVVVGGTASRRSIIDLLTKT